jgi:hypothetical protein
MTKVENVASYTVKRQFPNQAKHIEALLDKDRGFMELCSDYRLCLLTIEGLKAKERETCQIVNDYTNLLGDLKKEIDYYLSTTL